MEKVLADILALGKDFSGDFGFCVQRIGSEQVLAWNADEVFNPASVIKVPILTACLNKVQQGKLALDLPIRLKKEDQMIGSGVLKELTPGLTLTLEDLLTLMIIVSDNTATNMVLDQVSPSEVTAYMAGLGLKHIISARKMFQLDVPRTSEVTPGDILKLLVLLAKREILTPALCDKAIGILLKQQDTDIIARCLPYEPFLAEEGGEVHLQVASKSGAMEGINHDVGLVITDQFSYAIVLMSKNSKDTGFHPDHEAKLFFSKVSRRILDAFMQGELK